MHFPVAILPIRISIIDRFPVIMEAQDAGFYARSDILFFLMRKEGIQRKKKKTKGDETYDYCMNFYTGRAFEAYEYFGAHPTKEGVVFPGVRAGCGAHRGYRGVQRLGWQR